MVMVKDSDPADVAWNVTLEWTAPDGTVKSETHVVQRTPGSDTGVAIFTTGKAVVQPATAVPLTVAKQATVERRAVRHMAFPEPR
jgi:hypothetical protein